MRRQVYADPADIDIYLGGLAETPVADGVVGDTFSCYIGKPVPIEENKMAAVFTACLYSVHNLACMYL